ncbi:hypothetical protein YC2023_057191 [Brassica napus]
MLKRVEDRRVVATLVKGFYFGNFQKRIRKYYIIRRQSQVILDARSVVKSNTGALWCYKNNINRSDLYICLWFRKQNLAK